MAQEKEYFAFISYQRKDEEWADRLRSKLEHYRLPSSVRKQDASLPKEIRPIFRDALELAGGVLAKEIETALQQSKFLIVICSPNSAISPWVNKEVQTFIDLGREDRIIPFIIDGTPFSDNEETECFPPALRSLKGEKELLGININELSRDAASIKVVARMFGLKFDTLWQRYEREKKRRRWMMIGGTTLFALVCLGVGLYIAEKNVELKSANEKIGKEKERADTERDRAEKTRDSLKIAFDSIAQQNILISEQKDEITKEKNNVEKANYGMKVNLSRILTEKASELMDKGDSYLARLIALEALPPKLPYTIEAESALRKACQKDNALLNGHGIQIYSIAFSPDGKQLASGAFDGTIHLWNPYTGSCIDTLKGHNTLVKSIEYTKDGKYIISRSEKDENVIVWNALTGEDVSSNIIDSDSLIMYLARTGIASKATQLFSYTPGYVATMENNNNAVIIKGKLNYSRRFTSIKGNSLHASFSKDGNLLLTALNNTVKIWDFKRGICRDSLSGHLMTVSKAVFSSDGEKIASASLDHTVRIWNVKTRKTEHILKGHTKKVISALFSRDSRYVASSSADSTVRIWDVRTGDCIQILKHKAVVNTVSFSIDGRLLLTGTAKMDNRIHVWDAASGKCVKILNGHKISITSVAYSPDGRFFASASASSENSIRLWDSKSYKNIRTLLGHKNHVFSVSFSKDGSKIVSASEDKTVRVWDVKSGICLVVFDDFTNRVNHAEFSPDGKHIVSASSDGTIKILDFPPLQQLIDETRERFKDRHLTPEERRKYYLE